MQVPNKAGPYQLRKSLVLVAIFALVGSNCSLPACLARLAVPA